jgi:hypothetical protein
MNIHLLCGFHIVPLCPLQGLNKIDMVTMVVGSHSIGGFRKLSSPDLTGCPFVPFDCTTSGQITTTSAPFDNNVFKVRSHADISCNMLAQLWVFVACLRSGPYAPNIQLASLIPVLWDIFSAFAALPTQQPVHKPLTMSATVLVSVFRLPAME